MNPNPSDLNSIQSSSLIHRIIISSIPPLNFQHTTTSSTTTATTTTTTTTKDRIARIAGNCFGIHTGSIWILLGFFCDSLGDSFGILSGYFCWESLMMFLSFSPPLLLILPRFDYIWQRCLNSSISLLKDSFKIF